MRKTYTLNVAGVTRELPLCPVNEKLDIAAFVMFSDVGLLWPAPEALLKKCRSLILSLRPKRKVSRWLMR